MSHTTIYFPYSITVARSCGRYSAIVASLTNILTCTNNICL